MPRARRASPAPEPPPIVVQPGVAPYSDPDDDVDPVAPELGDLDELIESDFGEGVTWYLYRGVFEGNAKNAARGPYIQKGTGAVDLDAIRDRFGGGWYVLRVKDAQGSYRKTLRFAIEGAPRVASDAPPPAPRTTASDDLAELNAELERLRLEYRIKLTRDRIAGNTPPPPTPAPAVDPLAMFERALNVARSLMPAGAAAVDPTRALEVSLDLIERMESRGTGRDAGWADVARDFVRESLPRVIGFLESRVPPRAPVSAPTPTPTPAGAPQLAPVTRPSGPGYVVTLLLEGFRDQLEPDELADDFERKLTNGDLEALRAQPPDVLLGMLPTYSAEFRKDDAHPEAHAEVDRRIEYARAVLTELRTPPPA